jgi:hypothetical protein
MANFSGVPSVEKVMIFTWVEVRKTAPGMQIFAGQGYGKSVKYDTC